MSIELDDFQVYNIYILHIYSHAKELQHFKQILSEAIITEK